MKYLFLAMSIYLIAPHLAFAQTTTDVIQQPQQDHYFLGTVTNITDSGIQHDELSGGDLPYQNLQVRLDETSKVVPVEYGSGTDLQPDQLVKVGDRLVLTENDQSDVAHYDVIDRYRLPAVGGILLLFCIVVIVASRWKGVGALVGLAISLWLLVEWMIPQIMAGQNALLVIGAGITVIAVLSFYLGHGFSIRTTIALVSTLVVLGVAAGLSLLATWVTALSGSGNEEAMALKYSYLANVDLKQLLLAGMMIAVLGVLDDITTAQAAVIEELHIANPKLTWTELFRKGFNVGREHIISLVNTLVLVYAGTSLSLIIILATDKSRPLWIVLNSEQMIQTVVQTIVGNFALILAVPLTTLAAALWWARQSVE